jgi:hypothetical protein
MDSRRWTAAIAVVALAVCALTLAYLGSSRALAEQRATAAQRTLRLTISHRSEVIALLREEPLDRLAIDPAMSQLADDLSGLEDYRLRIDRALAVLGRDRAALARSRRDLQMPKALGFYRQSGLERESHRVAMALRGLDCARSALTIKRRQSVLVETILDGDGTLANMSPDIGRADWEGALDLHARAQLDLEVAGNLAAAGDVPPAVRDFVARLELSLEHVQALVQAAAARNLPAVDRLAGVVEADGQALSSFDPAPAEAWNAARLEPLIATYQAGLLAVG